MYRTLSILSMLAITSSALAAPARLITSPPVLKTGNPQTGPGFDPLATQGQWFLRPNGVAEVRPYEFYDNVDIASPIGSLAIKGQVTNIAISGGNMTSFDLTASITNDLGPPDTAVQGFNSHQERLGTVVNYAGTMHDVKMTMEFAFPSLVPVPAAVLGQIASNTAPYRAPNYGGQNAQIIAQNEDQWAWYCYTPPNGTGDFLVPTYDFGNIAPGQTATRTIHFNFGGAGIGPGHPLFPQMQNWFATGQDILLNRTEDLKIGDWVDLLAADAGPAYPIPPSRAGNVSVFFNPIPEPSAVAVLVPLGLAAARRRRRVAQ